MSIEPRRVSASELECFLGDPFQSESLVSHRTALEDDEREALPEATCAALAAWRFRRWFVPESAGGLLGSHEDLAMLWRTLGRRDVTASVVEVITYIGATPVWVAGTPTQQKSV